MKVIDLFYEIVKDYKIDDYSVFHVEIENYKIQNNEIEINLKNNLGGYNKIYCNLQGKIHRIDGPALICHTYHNHYYLNNNWLWSNTFAEETNHLICVNCLSFCGQKCFVL